MATLLLADDSLTTQKVVNLTFADEGIEVITADDGDTALQLFHERQPDLVLADVNMPGLNGYEVCEAIRKTNDAQKTPVVLLVGSFEPFDAQEAHRVGANDYLTKPFSSIRRLVATVLAFLDEPPSAAEPASPMDEIEEITVEPSISDAETIEFEQSLDQASEVPENTTEEIQPVESASTESDSPVSKLSEPDMYSTQDIEELYTQSFSEVEEIPETQSFAETVEIPSALNFAETVEMPHTIAERAQFNDGSLDDELIDATFSTPQPAATELEQEVEPQLEVQAPEEDLPASEDMVPTVEIPVEQQAEEPESAAFETAVGLNNGYVEALQYPEEETAEINVEPKEAESVPTDFETSVEQAAPPAEELSESSDIYEAFQEMIASDVQEPVQEVGPQDVPDGVQEISPQDAPTEEYNFEYRTEETYFEPAAEPAVDSAEPAEILQETSPASNLADEHTERTEETIEAQAEDMPQAATTTPWDSVANTSREFSFDESNLLELPVDSKSYTENNSDHGRQSDGSLSAETVERIVRIVASQMSEQLIREIAERVVPMVVEETLARRDPEEVNR